MNGVAEQLREEYKWSDEGKESKERECGVPDECLPKYGRYNPNEGCVNSFESAGIYLKRSSMKGGISPLHLQVRSDEDNAIGGFMRMLSNAPDDELVERTLNGQLEAFDELVHRYLKRVFAFVFQLVNNREDAEDLVQDTFVRAFQRLCTYQRGRDFVAWLMGIAAREVLKHRRQCAKRAQLMIISHDDLPEATMIADYATDDSHPISNQMLNVELRLDIQRALAKLTPLERAALHLCLVEGYSSSEAAQILGCAAVTVRTHLWRAKRKLRKELSDYAD